jgi:hypothetical protein
VASGECEIVHRGRRRRLRAPRLVGRTEGGEEIPSIVRFVLDLLGVQEFLRLETVKG